MCSYIYRTLMITNWGRACQRVLRNIDEYRPTEIIVFVQEEDPLWSEKNEEYRLALSDIKSTPIMEKYIKAGRLIEEAVPSITAYTRFFAVLAEIIAENKDNFDIIYIDCTGLPKLSTIVASHLAGMYDYVFPIYNRSTITAGFKKERDAEYSRDRGQGPEPLPFTKINVKWINEPESSNYQVLKAAYFLAGRPENLDQIRFNDYDLKNALKELGSELSPEKSGKHSFPIKLSKARDTMLHSGLFSRDLRNPKLYKLSLPGYALAHRIFENSKLERHPGKNIATKRPKKVGFQKGH